ncbi:MAG: hypothetical protein ACI959_001445 [Limisphaerales bacterium]|jgi:hypothetical protein
MALVNIFDREGADHFIDRINKMTSQTSNQWGIMTPAQVLAHCNVAYEMAYTDKHPRPNAFVRFMLKMFVKGGVVNETPYKKNNRTAPQFVVKGDKDFDIEKLRLIDFINKTQELGASYWEGKESHSFGNLTAVEWNNSWSKHLDHHLTQFGA